MPLSRCVLAEARSAWYALVLAPVVFKRVAEYMHQGKEALLQDLVAKVRALLQGYGFRAV